MFFLFYIKQVLVSLESRTYTLQSIRHEDATLLPHVGTGEGSSSPKVSQQNLQGNENRYAVLTSLTFTSVRIRLCSQLLLTYSSLVSAALETRCAAPSEGPDHPGQQGPGELSASPTSRAQSCRTTGQSPLAHQDSSCNSPIVSALPRNPHHSQDFIYKPVL